MRKEVQIPCALNDLLEEKKDCPGTCPLRPYALDLQEFHITVGSDNQLIASRREQVGQDSPPYTSLSKRSMLDDCVNASLVITSRQVR